jgi:hypothetical protein
MAEKNYVIYAVVRRKALLLLRKSDRVSSLWMLPGGFNAMRMGFRLSLEKILEPYFAKPFVIAAKVVKGPCERVRFGNHYCPFIIVACRMIGRRKESAKGRVWFAKNDALLPQILSPDSVQIVNLAEIQSLLA